MEYESGQNGDSDMKSSDSDFSDASEDDMGAQIVHGWTFVTDPFLHHHETSVKEFCKQFDIHPALLLSDAKSVVDYFEIFFLSYLLLVAVD